MPYEKQNWENRPATTTPLSASRLNHLEDGVADAHEQLDGRLSEAGLSATIAADIAVPRRMASPGGGALCISIDDAYSAMRVFAGLLEERGQRGTFCITPDLMNDSSGATKIVDQDILNFHAAGHEIAAHSKTHANLTNITPAQAVVELEYPKTYLENLLGVPVTTWAYPFGTSSSGRNATTDAYVYPLYERVLDTMSGQYTSLWPRWMEPPALIQRTAWTGGTRGISHSREMVKRAADSPVIAHLFFHDFGTANNPTLQQAIDLLDYAVELGVPVITAREAYGGFHYLTNPSFEDGLDGWNVYPVGGGTIEVVDAAPDAGITGSKVLQITAPASTGGGYVSQRQPVQPGRTYRASGRARVISGTIAQANDNYIRIRYGAVDGSTISTEVMPAAWTTAAWEKKGFDLTPPANAAYVLFDVVCADVTTGAVMQFDHMYFGPLTQFDLG